MKAPVLYLPRFIPEADDAFRLLQTGLEWERRTDAPRCEYYCNDFPAPYVYGRGRGARLYEPRPWHPEIKRIRDLLGGKYEVCFLNRYLNQRDQLGWHSDNSPEMDGTRPIAIVSLGEEREILFRKIGETETERLNLGHGSVCFMMAGMQDEWQHRIPKASFQCGERISLTFRGYVV